MNEKRMMQCREMTRCEDDAKELNRLIGEAEKLNASTDSELNYAFHEWADDAIERLAGGETVSLVSPGNREMTLRVKIMQTMKEYRSRRAELSKRVEICSSAMPTEYTGCSDSPKAQMRLTMQDMRFSTERASTRSQTGTDSCI